MKTLILTPRREIGADDPQAEAISERMLAKLQRECDRRSEWVMALPPHTPTKTLEEAMQTEERDYLTLIAYQRHATPAFWLRHQETSIDDLLEKPWCPFCGARCAAGWHERFLAVRVGKCGCCSQLVAQGNWREKEAA